MSQSGHGMCLLDRAALVLESMFYHKLLMFKESKMDVIEFFVLLLIGALFYIIYLWYTECQKARQRVDDLTTVAPPVKHAPSGTPVWHASPSKPPYILGAVRMHQINMTTGYSASNELKKHKAVWESIDSDNAPFHLVYHEDYSSWKYSFNPYLLSWNWDVLILPNDPVDDIDIEDAIGPLTIGPDPIVYAIKSDVASRLLYFSKDAKSLDEVFNMYRNYIKIRRASSP